MDRKETQKALQLRIFSDLNANTNRLHPAHVTTYPETWRATARPPELSRSILNALCAGQKHLRCEKTLFEFVLDRLHAITKQKSEIRFRNRYSELPKCAQICVPDDIIPS